MAMLFHDSFEHHTIASQKWTAQRGDPNASLDLVTGRFGNGWSMNSRYITKALGANYATLIMGMALKPVSVAGLNVIGFVDGNDRTLCQCNVFYDAGSGFWSARRQNTVLATSAIAYPIPNGSFAYVECKATIHDTTGAMEIRLNGQVILTVTGVNTRGGTANNQANSILAGDFNDNSSSWVIDDVYVLDLTDSGVSGAPNNTYLGDIRVECKYPNGNGNSSVLVGSDGNSVDNYLLIDEATPNSDTDYVESSTPGDKDTYTFQDLTSTAGSIYSVGIHPFAKKTDAGTRSIKTIARLSGTEVDGPEQFLSSGYGYYSDYRQAKPGGGQWTITDVNNAEFGVKVFA